MNYMVVEKCNYHESELKPPERVQKRVVLHQAYKIICSEIRNDSTVLYITFGGSGLWDVLDLLVSLDPKRFAVDAFSYEQDRTLFNEANDSPVYRQLNRLGSVNIELVRGWFPNAYLETDFMRSNAQTAIYYLDWKEVFAARHAEDIAEIFKFNLINSGDYLLITSCLNERVVNQSKFLEEKKKFFEKYYGDSSPGLRQQNFVELLINLRLRQKDIWVGMEQSVEHKSLELLAKFVYRDTSKMGLWVFRIYDSEQPGEAIPKSEFIDYLELSKPKEKKETFNPFL